MKTILLLLLLSSACFSQVPRPALPYGAKAGEKLTVTVHPGVELLSIIQYLAGYAGPGASPYRTAVRAHFAPFRNHPAVLFLFNSDARFGYDLPELGWCFDNPLNPKAFTIPDSTYWLNNFSRSELTRYLTLCMDFAQQSQFASFYQRHQADYDRWGQAYRRQVDSAGVVQKLESFFHQPTASRWYICLDPLNSAGAHAIMTKTLAPTYGQYIVYQQGYWNRQAKPKIDPIFEADVYNLVWHEGSHVYTNPIQQANRIQIDSLSYLMRESELLSRQNITDWPHFVDESLVRAIATALSRAYRSPQQAQQRLVAEQRSGFVYTDQLAQLILEDYIQTNAYSSFAAYFPILLGKWAQLKPDVTN